MNKMTTSSKVINAKSRKSNTTRADINNMILIKNHFTFDDHNFVGWLAKIRNGKTTMRKVKPH